MSRTSRICPRTHISAAACGLLVGLDPVPPIRGGVSPRPGVSLARWASMLTAPFNQLDAIATAYTSDFARAVGHDRFYRQRLPDLQASGWRVPR